MIPARRRRLDGAAPKAAAASPAPERNNTDAVVAKFRDEITALDVRIVNTINERIKKVAALRAHKAAHGLAFVDPDREAELIAYLKRVNGGPLSDAGLEELMAFVLDLVKREVQ